MLLDGECLSRSDEGVIARDIVRKARRSTRIGIGIVGAGYMGRVHAVAMTAVGAVFDTTPRPSLEMICATSAGGAADKARGFGFAGSTADWRATDVIPAARKDDPVTATSADPTPVRTPSRLLSRRAGSRARTGPARS
mgnify:CR=1 FL=1